MANNEPQNIPVHGIRPPHPILFDSNIAQNWKLFKQKWNDYALILNLTQKEIKYQVALLRHTIGDDGLRVYNGFKFDTAEDQRTIDEIFAKFDTFAIGEVNETYERFIFNRRNQNEGETFENFNSSIRTLVKTCNYCDNCLDSILRDRIVLGTGDFETQSSLLKQRNLTLASAVDICKTAENANSQSKILKPLILEKDARDVVITDHRSQVSIVKKPVSKAPKRLQSLNLRAQEYNYSLSFKPGNTIPIADALSCAPVGEPTANDLEYEKTDTNSLKNVCNQLAKLTTIVTGMQDNTTSQQTQMQKRLKELQDQVDRSQHGSPVAPGHAVQYSQSDGKVPPQVFDDQYHHRSIGQTVSNTQVGEGPNILKNLLAAGSGDSQVSSSTRQPEINYPMHIQFPNKKDQNIVSPEHKKQHEAENQDEDIHIESVDGPHFESVIQLLDKINVVTGEEDEEILFCQRVKLYQYEVNQWKERGVGDMKILHNKSSNKCRIVMRREQILKLCANHYITPEMKLGRHGNQDKALTWTAMDHSDPDVPPRQELLAARFKEVETAVKFKEVFIQAKKIVQETVTASPLSSTATASATKPIAVSVSSTGTFKLPTFSTSTAATTVQETPVQQKIQSQTIDSTSKGTLVAKKEAGAWSCSCCYAQNPATAMKCKCCETPNLTAPKAEASLATKPSLVFSFGMPAKPSGFLFGIPPSQVSSSNQSSSDASKVVFGDGQSQKTDKSPGKPGLFNLAQAKKGTFSFSTTTGNNSVEFLLNLSKQ